MCDFYRFIQVEIGIRERREKMRKGREARAILGKKKERKKEGKRLKGRRKKIPELQNNN